MKSALVDSYADGLKTSAGEVDTRASAAPAAGNVLTATGPNTAEWQAPSGGATLADGDYGDIVVSLAGTAMNIDVGVVVNNRLATAAAGTVKSNISGGVASPSDNTISAVLDYLFGTTRGSVIYRAAAAWAALGPGTSGYFLKTNGPGADPAWAAGGGGSANGGVAQVDFGAFPGASDASVAVIGQAGIVAGSSVLVQLLAKATTDHSADEHVFESVAVVAGNIVAGTGFTIYAKNTNTLNEPLVTPGVGYMKPTAVRGLEQASVGGNGTRIYGKWSVAWTWV